MLGQARHPSIVQQFGEQGRIRWRSDSGAGPAPECLCYERLRFTQDNQWHGATAGKRRLRWVARAASEHNMERQPVVAWVIGVAVRVPSGGAQVQLNVAVDIAAIGTGQHRIAKVGASATA